MLIHVGLDTVKMNGDGFAYFVKVDQQVKAGDALMTFDSAKIKKAGFSNKIAVILTEVPENVKMELITEGNVTAVETILNK